MGAVLDRDEEQLSLPLGDDDWVKVIVAKLEVIDTALKAVVEDRIATDRLWSYRDIGKYMDCSESVARRIMKRSTAPKPIRIPTSPGSFLPDRFNSQEIIDYAMRRKKGRIS